LFWNTNGKFRDNASKVGEDFNVLPDFPVLCCQSARFCVHPLARRPQKGPFPGGVRILYPKRSRMSNGLRGMFEKSLPIGRNGHGTAGKKEIM